VRFLVGGSEWLRLLLFHASMWCQSYLEEDNPRGTLAGIAWPNIDHTQDISVLKSMPETIGM